MTETHDKITDAYIFLQVGSETLSCDELREMAGFEPTKVGIKGNQTVPNVPRAGVLPWSYLVISTEHMTTSKSLDDHIFELKKRLAVGRLADRFDLSKVTIRAIVYWWTTEVVYFSLNSDSLETLHNIGVPIDFNYAVYPDEAENE